MAHIIKVAPADIGWMVSDEAFDNPMLFLSGARAEQAARALAEQLARRGQAAEVRIYLRDGTLGGRFAGAPALRLAG